MSNTVLFRLFIVAGFVLGCAGSGVDFLVPGLMPHEVREAVSAYAQGRSIPIWEALALGLLMVVIVVAGLASTVGLFLLRRWARGLALWASVVSLLTYPALGPMVFSGWAFLLLEVSMALWGAALAMAYFSELKSNFSSERGLG